jgi:signal transduction histidine kinase
MAYGIIRRHRGELEVPRNEGQGGVVTFHLPPHRAAKESLS